MERITYISNLAVPITILLIVICGVVENNKVFELFLFGVEEGMKIVIKIFPTLLGLFVAIGTLRCSGILDAIIKLIYPFISYFKIPPEIMPLAILKPISGSASIAVGNEIMNKYGVDSKIGLIASTIMGSTETTLYAISVYTSVVGIKKIRFVLIAALIGDIVGMLVSVIICNIMS